MEKSIKPRQNQLFKIAYKLVTSAIVQSTKYLRFLHKEWNQHLFSRGMSRGFSACAYLRFLL